MVFNKIKGVLNKRYRFQILATMTVHILTLSHGIGIGWLSPILRLLQSPNTPLHFIVSVDDASWIGSLFGLGMLTGNILFGLLVDRVGRKISMYLLALPHLSFWLLVYFVQSVEFLYVARLLAGTTSGGIYVVVPLYVSEIADVKVRGALSSITMFIVSIGILLGFILAAELNYFLLPLIMLALPVLYALAIFSFPDTPQYLLRKGEIEQAQAAFAFYKNTNAATPTYGQQSSPEKRNEFDELRVAILQNHEAKKTLKDFTNGSTLFTFFTSAMLILLNQLSGSFAIINYMSAVFTQSGSTMDPDFCTIIMGIIQIAGTCATIILVDHYGRKILLLTSAVVMAIAMIALGAFAQFTPKEKLADFSWVPVVLMAIIIFSASWGVTALIFTLIVETLPAKIRSEGTSISLAFMSIMVFVSLKIYPLFIYELGISITMYSCAGVCIVGTIYHYFFLPETKNKSMDFD